MRALRISLFTAAIVCVGSFFSTLSIAQSSFVVGRGMLYYNQPGSTGVAFDTTPTGHQNCFGAGYSKELIVKNFNIGVPAGAHVKGIRVALDVIINNLIDSSIVLLKNGVPYGTDGAHRLPIISASDISWGDTASMWGGVWGPMSLNDTAFGIKLRIKEIDGTHLMSWGDANPVFIKVTYDFDVPNSVDATVLPDMQVYPNPATDGVHIDFGQTIADGSIRLLNITGSVVKVLDNINGTSSVVTIADQPRGMYILEVRNNGAVKRMKIMKE